MHFARGKKKKVILHLSTTKFCISFLLLMFLSNILKIFCVYWAVNTQNVYLSSSLACVLVKTSRTAASEIRLRF